MERKETVRYEQAYTRWLENLVDARRRQGLSQMDIASALGMSQRVIYKFESGLFKPSYVRLMEFAEAYDVSLGLFCQTEIQPAVVLKKNRPAASRKEGTSRASAAPQTSAVEERLHIKIEAVVSGKVVRASASMANMP